MANSRRKHISKNPAKSSPEKSAWIVREQREQEFREVQKALNEYKRCKATAIAEVAKLEEAKQEVQDALDAQKLIQEVAAAVQTQANERIAAVVGRALKTVFPGSGYDFAIRFERKAGRTQARMVYLKDGEEADPKDDSGGVGDIASFALRLACLLFSGKRRLLTLDEPFRQVAANRINDAGRLLELLSEELDLQVVIVTHDPELQVGKVINLGDQ